MGVILEYNTKEAAVDNRRTSSRLPAHRYGALLAVCLLGASWSAAAAPGAFSNCDEAVRALPSLQVVPEKLTLQSVDLMASDGRTSAPAETMEGSKVPYLFLTPRVTTILENVFGDDAAAKAATEDAGDASERPGTAEAEAAGSPVAGNQDAPQAAPETPAFESTEMLPRFQRPMYRTDI